MSELPPCPKCRGNGVFRNVRASGWAQERFFPDGDTQLVDERVVYNKTKRARCLDCGCVRTDVEFVSGGPVSRSESG